MWYSNTQSWDSIAYEKANRSMRSRLGTFRSIPTVYQPLQLGTDNSAFIRESFLGTSLRCVDSLPAMQSLLLTLLTKSNAAVSY